MDLRNLSLRHRSLLDAVANVNYSVGGLAEGTNANTYKTTNAITFSIKGRLYTKAATDNIAFATAGAAFVAQPDLSTCYYLILADSAGALTVLQGRDSLKASTAALGVAGAIPVLPDDLSASRAVIGVLKVVLSGGTFTPGSTDLSAAGVTDTWYDVAGVPPNGASDLA